MMLASKPHHARNGGPHPLLSPLAAKKSGSQLGFCKRLNVQALFWEYATGCDVVVGADLAALSSLWVCAGTAE
jgi:hypothetical protein